MKINKKYIIDLSDAATPSDIVFELSNIMEKAEASDQNIWLKLGDIPLNQSQILSINSLVNSINSTLSIIESKSEETKASAEALGISTQIEDELEANAPEAPVAEEEKPSEQYIPMSDHLDIEEKTSVDDKEVKIEEETKEEKTIFNTSFSVFDELKFEIKSEAEKSKDSVYSEDENEIIEEKQEETIEKNSEAEETTEKENLISNIKEEEKDVDSEIEQTESPTEIKEQLDSIFDSETKLENILNDEPDLSSLQNWPLTKEADEFEIPDEVMTDEDYAILQMGTQYHKQTVRSGQVIQSNGNVVIIGDCHPGCEIHAAGDITVWGVLGGIAHAGCKGNTKARIRALNLNAIQLRIADSYARRPDHIKNIYNEKTNTFTPEEARNINGSIVILKINDN